jgi:hypothetical protein
MKLYDKIRNIKDVEGMDREGLEITKKIDGSNARFTGECGMIVWGSRNQETVDYKQLSAPYNVIFKEIDEKIVALPHEYRNEIVQILEGMVIFGEMSGRLNRHKLDYPWDLQFIVFNGWDKQAEKYVSFSDPRVQNVMNALQLTHVEELPFTIYEEAVTWVKVQNPKDVEGFVAKDYKHQLMCKMYVPGNEEIESAKFVKHKRSPCYGESKFLHRYITRARIEKLLMKMMEGGQKPIMTYTPALLKALWNDMLFECLPEFLNEERVFRDVPASKNDAGEDVKAYKEEVFDIGYVRKELPQIAVGIMKEIACEAK